jgi:beta-phosphoglucomutase-like phosphatase (HAD superfamily)
MSLKIGLATSSVGELIRPFLLRHDIMRFFDEIVTGEEVQRGKPNPDIYLRAADKVHVAPEYCLVVEDALSGIQAGKSAGMTVVAIPDPRFVDVRDYDGKADHLITTVGELPDFVKSHFAVGG